MDYPVFREAKIFSAAPEATDSCVAYSGELCGIMRCCLK